MISNKKPLNLLFTCVGRRNYLINYFREVIDSNDRIIAVDMSSSASALAEADVVYKVSHIESPAYIDELLSIVKKEKISAIISLNDMELPKLAINRLQFESHGAAVLVSNEEIIDICFDKWKTYLFLKDIGFNTPKTFLSIDDVLKDLNNSKINFPLIVKPRWGSASIGINEVDSEKELKLSCELLSIRIQKLFQCRNNNYLDVSKSIVIQEKLIGQEYGMDILNDFDGNYYDCFVRKKLGMRSGETDKAVSVINDEYSNIGKILGRKMKHFGNMDCDFFVSNGKVYFLEMNPRFGGGYPFSHRAGINVPGIYISWIKGLKDFEKYNNYVAGKGFAKYDLLGDLNIFS